jgi:two-component system response regulator HydG
LENAIERAVVLTEDDVIKPSDLLYYGLNIESAGSYSGGAKSLADMEKEHIAKMLETFDGHRAKTAKALGIDRKTLRMKLKGYGME